MVQYMIYYGAVYGIWYSIGSVYYMHAIMTYNTSGRSIGDNSLYMYCTFTVHALRMHCAYTETVHIRF